MRALLAESFKTSDLARRLAVSMASGENWVSETKTTSSSKRRSKRCFFPLGNRTVTVQGVTFDRKHNTS